MSPKKIILLQIIASILFSCSGSLTSLYNFDYPLTDETAYSTSTNISVKIPQDWYTAEDNECNCSVLWLVKNDLSASLVFNFITIDDETRKEISGNELEEICGYNKLFVKAKLGKSFGGFFNEETFEINGKKFAAYQYEDNEKRTVRVVVFKHKEKFYELTALHKNETDPTEIYRIQNTILTTIN